LSDKLQADVDAAYYYDELGITKMALMHDNGDYGLGLAELLQASFEAKGGEVVAFEGITVGESDFRAVLTQIAASEPELIFFGGYATEAGLIAAQMKETGLEGALFASGDGTKTDQYLDAAGAAAEGSYISAPVGDQAEDAIAEFNAKYEEEYGVKADDLGPFHANSYDTVLMIANAIEQVGVVDDSGKLTIDREELIAAVRGTSGLQGLTGELTCTEIGDCGPGGIQIFTIENGAWVQVSGYGL
jgi:branched-chain amino acid transport system substrate-binding protein